MWLFSKEFNDDVFVSKVENGSVLKLSQENQRETWVEEHGDIVTFWNPKRDLWDKGELSDFLPPKYHK